MTPDSTSHAGFLADILAHPDDDTPRLIYADWLDENGDEARAEFIRVQYALAKRGDCGHGRDNFFYLDGTCKPCELRWRERELFGSLSLLKRKPCVGKIELLRWWPVAWNEAERLERGSNCPTLCEAIEGTPRRGFIDSLTLCWQDFAAHADAILAAHPVCHVTLTTTPKIDFTARTDPRQIFYVRLEGMRRLHDISRLLPHTWMQAGEDVVCRRLLKVYFPSVKTFTLPT